MLDNQFICYIKLNSGEMQCNAAKFCVHKNKKQCNCEPISVNVSSKDSKAFGNVFQKDYKSSNKFNQSSLMNLEIKYHVGKK